MLRYCDFIDECVDIGYLSEDSISIIDKYHCDKIILTNSRKAFIKHIQATNTKLIITPIKLFALFAARVRTPALHLLFMYRSIPEWQRHLLLARCVDGKKYDKKSLPLDFAQAKISVAKKHRDFAKSCMQDSDRLSGGGGGIIFLLILLAMLVNTRLAQKGGLIS